MEIILGLFALVASVTIIFWTGVTSGRNQARRDDLEDWEGVEDIRQTTRDRVKSDPDYAKRVQDEFND